MTRKKIRLEIGGRLGGEDMETRRGLLGAATALGEAVPHLRGLL